MSTFGQLPLIAPIANVIAVPFLTVLVAAGLVLLPASLIPFAFELAVSFLAITADLFTSCASLLASIPGASIPVDLELAPVGFVTALVCFLWWWAWPRPTLRNATLIGCLVLLLAFGVVGLRTSAAGDNLVMLDVGQGDAFLYESEGMSLLVDTGNQEAKLLSALASEGVSHLDGVVLSHADDDHVGCLGSLRGYIAVDTVFVANGYAESDEEKVLSVMREAERLTGSDPVELKMGSRFTVGRFAFEVLAPERLRNDSDNQDSLCLLATLDPGEPGGKTWRILTAGDAESETLDPLARTGAIDDIDVLKVSHHGSRLSVDEELLERSQPEVALISVGEGNRYGHPHHEVLDLLQDEDIRIYRTDRDGDIAFRVSENKIEDIRFSK
jgi:competence protein ComEC